MYLLLLHCNNGYTNVPQCYVIVHCLSCHKIYYEVILRFVDTFQFCFKLDDDDNTKKKITTAYSLDVCLWASRG